MYKSILKAKAAFVAAGPGLYPVWGPSRSVGVHSYNSHRTSSLSVYIFLLNCTYANHSTAEFLAIPLAVTPPVQGGPAPHPKVLPLALTATRPGPRRSSGSWGEGGTIYMTDATQENGLVAAYPGVHTPQGERQTERDTRQELVPEGSLKHKKSKGR